MKEKKRESESFEVPVIIKDADVSFSACQGCRKNSDGDEKQLNKIINEEKNVENVVEPAAGEERAQEVPDRERIAQLEEQVRRISAEFENFRRRQEKRYEEAVKFAAEDVITQFLPVLDSLNHALASSAGEGDSAGAVVQGLEMIRKQLLDTLDKLGLTVIEAVGEPFNPEIHHAVMTEENSQYENDTVSGEFQKGYKYKDRVIRPSMVKVAKTP